MNTFVVVKCAAGAMILVAMSSCGSGRLEAVNEPTSLGPVASATTRSASAEPTPEELAFPDGFLETMSRHGLVLEPAGKVTPRLSAREAVDVAVSTWALFGRDDALKVELFRATLPELGPLSDPNDPGSPVVPTFVDVPMWVIYAEVELPRFEPSPELGTAKGTAVAVVTAEGEAVSAWTF